MRPVRGAYASLWERLWESRSHRSVKVTSPEPDESETEAEREREEDERREEKRENSMEEVRNSSNCIEFH